jgi:hypothetical protein
MVTRIPLIALLLGAGACSPAPDPADAIGAPFDPLVRVRPHLPFRTLSAPIDRGVLRVDAE